MSGGGALGDVGRIPESVTGAERSEPSRPDDTYLTKQDITAPTTRISGSQINVQSLLSLRATIMAALQQVETALLLNGVVLSRSSQRKHTPGGGDESSETPPTFGARTNTEAE